MADLNAGGHVLVTGGAGFIGSHVVDELIKAGHRVWVVDDLSSGSTQNLNPAVEFERLDIRDRRTGELIEKARIKTVFHLAAQMDVRKSVKDPELDLQINIAGSVRLLEWARAHGVERFIFSSTGGAIYGEQDVFPAPESHPTRPISPYGVAKLAVERYMFFYHSEYHLNCTALRYANVYGPRQNPHGEAGVVAIFAGKLSASEEAFIWGDGLQTRDYTYVGDIARLNLLAMVLEGFHIVNAGTGIETDVLTLFDEINLLCGGNAIRQHKPPALGEQRRSSIDASFAGELLGWKPEVSFREGLGKTVEYFRGTRAKELPPLSA